MAYVYRHIRLDKNEPFYIGISSDSNYKRAYNKLNRNKFWNNIVSQTDYEVEILLDNLSYKDVLEKEKEFITLYGRINKNTGCLSNLTDGGEGQEGIVRSEEYRQKLRESAKKRWSNNDFKERTIKSLKGSHSNYKVSEETKVKIGLANKGKKKKPLTEEVKQKIRIAAIGRKHSEETKLLCRQKSLEMWANKEKAIEIMKSMKGTQKRAKIKKNDKS